MASQATGFHLAPTAQEIYDLRLVARGLKAPSLIIRNGSVLSVHSGEVLERDVVVSGRHIAAITPHGHFASIGDTTEILDAKGNFVAPGLLDSHIHIEYTKLTPGELARLSVPRGTTTVLADPNCIANVCGVPGMEYMSKTNTPLRILRQVSHKVPNLGEHLELGGKRIETDELARLVQLSSAVSLGESNPFSLDMDSAIKQSAALAAGKRVVGHTALLSNEPLWAYAAGGIGDDHNASMPDDMMERIRLGLMITIMSGSMNSNIKNAFSDLPKIASSLDHFSFCADDKLCEDIASTGHIDRHVREAIALGVDPIAAWRMGTWNPARYYRVDHLVGSITPCKLADILILPNLHDVRPEVVIVSGEIVARDNRALFQNTDPIEPFTLNTLHIHSSMLEPETFAVAAGSTGSSGKAWVQAMEMYDGYFKRAFHCELDVDPSTGHVLSSTDLDVLKVTVIDRHHCTPNRGIGFVRGFGLKEGAIACTTNCEALSQNQNLVVISTTDFATAAAVRAFASTPELRGGGFVVVDKAGQLTGSVPLAVAGCMSALPWEVVQSQSIACNIAAEQIGCTMAVPFMIASFIGLGGVPDFGLTELGLVETSTQTLMDVVLKQSTPPTPGQAEVQMPTVVCCRCPSHAHDVHRLMDESTYVIA